MVFFSWLLRTLLASVTPIINADLLQQQQSSDVAAEATPSPATETPRLLGVLLALRHLMAQIVASDKSGVVGGVGAGGSGSGVDDWLKAGSFGAKSTASSLPKEGQSG